VEEKPLSESSKTFTLNNFDALGEEKRRLSELPTESSNIRDSLEAERTEENFFQQEARSYQLNELTIESSSMRRGFTYDSEKARNFDQASVNKAKEGVKEILKDTLGKAKRQAKDIKAHAQKGFVLTNNKSIRLKSHRKHIVHHSTDDMRLFEYHIFQK
jgi:hypothetical protein